MQRACFVFQLKEGAEEEYKRRHDEIWPELVEAIQDSGLKNYTLFRRGLQVIGYVECLPDVETAFAKVESTEVNARWDEWFEEIIEEITDADGNLFWAKEVWHLD